MWDIKQKGTNKIKKQTHRCRQQNVGYQSGKGLGGGQREFKQMVVERDKTCGGEHTVEYTNVIL